MSIQPSFFLVPHTHWDREWYQSFQDFRRRLIRLTDRLLDLLESDPAFSHFHFDGQTIVLEDYLEVRPENRERLRRLINAGRIAVGPWYVLPDEFLVSGESILRNLQIGHRIAAEFGTPLNVGYLPDQFGHIGQMPQILQLFGIEDAVVWRGVGADVDRAEFLWEAPDGSRVFTIFLPGWGYSNGRQLPVDAARLAARLGEIAAEHAPFRRTDILLVMNGTDHQEPQSELPAVLAQLRGEGSDVDARIVSLRTYVDAARQRSLDSREAERTSLTVHQGELRSPLRAHLLPGVTSMRPAQKQRDFRNVSLLERYAEPLATWADWLGARRDLTGFTDLAWKMAVQNHPHDSICGCSIDQVHRDMEYRFDQVEMMARAAAERGLRTVARRALSIDGKDGAPALVVYNANGPGACLVQSDVQLEAPETFALVDSLGTPVPMQLQVGEGETLLDAEMPTIVVQPHVAAMYNRELMGFFINAVDLRQDGSKLSAFITLDRVQRGQLDMAAMRQRWLDLIDAGGVETVRVFARTAASVRLTAIADLAGHGVTAIRIAERTAGSPIAAPRGAAIAALLPLGEGREIAVLRNDLYTLTVHSDGTFALHDHGLDLVLPRCNWFVDEGDRGDEYNFDALLDSQAVTTPIAPARARIVSAGPLVATVEVEQVYALPRNLAVDRETRSGELVEVPMVSRLTLYAGLRRVEVETSLDNRACDHRLRAHFETPLRADAISCEQAFDVVRRSIDLEAGGDPERPIGTVPQKTFSCIEAGGKGVALFNRGIQEVEAVRGAGGTALAMTLMRSVGWLSRGDLRMRNSHAGPGLETPGGQSLGSHRYEYALTTYEGDWESAHVVGQAHAYAFPPQATLDEVTELGACSLVECDNAHIIVSAITPSRKKGALQVRLYNSSHQPQEAVILVHEARAVCCVDLLERKQRCNLRRLKRGWRLGLKPAEIVTLQVVR